MADDLARLELYARAIGAIDEILGGNDSASSKVAAARNAIARLDAGLIALWKAERAEKGAGDG